MKRKRNPERPELNRIRVNRWRAAHPETERLRSQRKHLKKKYGITLEQKQQTFCEQGGKCANLGCRRVFNCFSDAHQDHDHETGVTRGLLCYQCNVSLGMLYESEGVIRGLADYLSQWEVAP